jgi:hypothetical protein
MNWRKLTDEEKQEEHQEMLDKQREAYRASFYMQAPATVDIQSNHHSVIDRLLKQGYKREYIVNFLVQFFQMALDSAQELVDSILYRDASHPLAVEMLSNGFDDKAALIALEKEGYSSSVAEVLLENSRPLVHSTCDYVPRLNERRKRDGKRIENRKDDLSGK